MKIQLFFVLIFFTSFLQGQNATEAVSITVKGRVYDINDSNVRPIAIVVNKRTGNGLSGQAGGTFTISGNKTDTFQISSGGYTMVRICFKDSVMKSTYSIKVGLKLKENMMNPVVIYPIKDLSDIQKERATVGVQQTRSTVGVTDAIESPITYIYERYSRDGKSRAMVAMLENEDRKNAILKDLFRTYNQSGVIDLKEEEFDNFILYLNMPENVLKYSTDYDLANYIRARYLIYRSAQHYHNSNQR